MRTAPEFIHIIEGVVCLFGSSVPEVRELQVDGCRTAFRDHEKSWRQFGHSLHRSNPWTVCVAPAARTEMSEAQKIGFVLHEVGHIIAYIKMLPEHRKKPVRGEKGTPEPVQAEADWVVKHYTGLTIVYDKDTLQSVQPGRFKTAVRWALEKS